MLEEKAEKGCEVVPSCFRDAFVFVFDAPLDCSHAPQGPLADCHDGQRNRQETGFGKKKRTAPSSWN